MRDRLYNVGQAYHTPGVISHVQELHVDVETHGHDGETPADAEIALVRTKQVINYPKSNSESSVVYFDQRSGAAPLNPG